MAASKGDPIITSHSFMSVQSLDYTVTRTNHNLITCADMGNQLYSKLCSRTRSYVCHRVKSPSADLVGTPH